MTPVRRRLLLGGAAGAVLLPRVARANGRIDPAAIAEIEQVRGGRLGVFAQAGDGGPTLEWRADERFPMGSTMKLPLAGLMLRRVQDGADRLDTKLRYGRADLIAVSPVTEAHVGEGELRIDQLVAAILERSDNSAANLLLAHAGGPEALNRFLRKIGDHTTIIRRGEVIGAPTDNDTTPRAFAAMVRTLCLGDVLLPALRDRLVHGMIGNLPGRARLRAGFPGSWQGADRTGTADGLCNDGAVAWRPHGAPLVVAAFYRADGADLPQQEMALRTVGKTVAAAFG